jgi:single-strand DNA-binding protein
MLNYLALTGELEHDPEIRYDGGHQDQAVATFPLVFQTGEKRTGRIKVACFGSLAELAERYLHHGARVAVAGILDQQPEGPGDGDGFLLTARSVEIFETDCWGNTAVIPLKSRG